MKTLNEDRFPKVVPLTPEEVQQMRDDKARGEANCWKMELQRIKSNPARWKHGVQPKDSITEVSWGRARRGLGFQGKQLMEFSCGFVRHITLAESIRLYFEIEGAWANDVFPDGTKSSRTFLRWVKLISAALTKFELHLLTEN